MPLKFTIQAFDIIVTFIEKFHPEVSVVLNCSMQWMDNENYGSSEQTVVKALLGARQALLEVRSTLRRIGEAAGVPVCTSTLFLSLQLP